MKCTDVHYLIGQALDSEVTEGEKQAFFDHLSKCGVCRTDFEIERTAKSLVRKNVIRQTAPSDVVAQIQESVVQEDRSRQKEEGWVDRLVGARMLAPALGVTLLVAALLYIMQSTGEGTNAASMHTAANDIINQTFLNFAKMRSGELRPTMISSYPEGVVGFFELDHLKFAVNIIPVENCDWYGAISTEFDGEKIAHVVYKIGDDTMYVYQVDKQSAMGGGTLTMPPAAMEALAKTGWYTDPTHPDCNVVMWTDGETLCSAVSSMNKDQLFAFLTTR